jgi:hypothetical protein
VTAPLLSRFFKYLLEGRSVKAAHEELHTPLALETFYHLLARLRRNLDRIRALLFNRGPPPSSARADPLLQTLEHLWDAFGVSACPLSAFQLTLQRPWLG